MVAPGGRAARCLGLVEPARVGQELGAEVVRGELGGLDGDGAIERGEPLVQAVVAAEHPGEPEPVTRLAAAPIGQLAGQVGRDLGPIEVGRPLAQRAPGPVLLGLEPERVEQPVEGRLALVEVPEGIGQAGVVERVERGMGNRALEHRA